MSYEDNTTNTELRQPIVTRPGCCGITLKDFLHFASQLLLPLLLAIFTVVVTFDQRNENRILRLEDRRQADEQRQQDLNISREQRENDRAIAESQRLHDRELAGVKREADDLNAAIQRNMTRDQRLYELEVEQERYKNEHEKYLDALLLSYYNEMGDLFQRTNEKPLSSNAIIFSLARAKTLNVIEQIGPIRAAHLLMFLYGAGQLSLGEQSLNLAEAQFNSIDLRHQRTLINIYLASAYLINASFAGKNVSYGNFQNAHLNGANFSGAICIGTRFDGAILIGADFSYTNIHDASFVAVDLRNATFYNTTGKNTHFEFARMQRTNFSRAHFDPVINYLQQRGFIESNLAHSDFRRAHLNFARFIFCNMTGIDLTDANLYSANLTASILSYARLDNTELGNSILDGTNLSFSNLSTIQCLSGYGNISSCRLRNVLSLANTQLPNGSIGVAPTTFLHDEGYPYCPSNVGGHSSPIAPDSHWDITPPDSVFHHYRLGTEGYLTFDACIFQPVNLSRKVEMKQRVNISNYVAIISARRAKATVICFVGLDTHVFISQYDDKNKLLHTSERIGFQWSELLRLTTTSLQVSIQFVNPIDEMFSWCHYIELHVEPDFKAPDTHLLYKWRIYD